MRHWLSYKWVVSHRQNQERTDDRLVRLAEENKWKLGYNLEKNVTTWGWQRGSPHCSKLLTCHVVGGLLAKLSCQFFNRLVLPCQSYQLHFLITQCHSEHSAHKYLPPNDHQLQEWGNSKRGGNKDLGHIFIWRVCSFLLLKDLFTQKIKILSLSPHSHAE